MSGLKLPDFTTEESRNATHFDHNLLMPFFIEHLQGNAYPERTACILPTAPIVTTDFEAKNRVVYLNAIYAYVDFREPEKSSLKTPKNFLKAVESCKLGSTRFGLIGLLIQYGGEKFGHMNMLLLDYASNTVERFDPDGQRRVEETLILDTLLNNMTQTINASGMEPLLHYRNLDINGLGPNLKQARGTHPDFVGYCVGWSILYAHVRMLNPPASPGDVIDSFLRMAPEELRDYIQRFHSYYEKTASEAVDISFLGQIKATGNDPADAKNQTTTSSPGKRQGSAEYLADILRDLHVAVPSKKGWSQGDTEEDRRMAIDEPPMETKRTKVQGTAAPQLKQPRKSTLRFKLEDELEERLRAKGI